MMNQALLPRPLFWGLLFLELALFSGCREPARSPLGLPAEAPSGLAARSTDSVEGERRIALMAPTGSRPIDGQIVILEERVRHNLEKLDNWIALGQAWIRKARESTEPGYYRNADACATVALALQPDSALALNLRGLVLLNDHKFLEAQHLAESIIRRSDFDPMAWGTLSDALLELGRLDGAEEAVQQMLALKPNLPSYARASYLHFLRGRSGPAKEAIRLAIDASPARRADLEPRAWALVQAANLFLHEGDYSGADAGYELALRSFSDYPLALVGRGQVALAQERYADAARYLDTAYKLNPLAETAWLLGEARHFAGDAAGADEACAALLQHGRRTDPRTVALYLASQSSPSERDLIEAGELIDRERSGRNDIYTQDIHAYVLFRRGRAAEARPIIDGVLAVGIKDARILYHAAAIHAATGDPAGAKALVEEALRRSPRFDVRQAAEARKLLGALSAGALAVR